MREASKAGRDTSEEEKKYHFICAHMYTYTSTYKFERIFFRYGRRNEPKFGTHVRIDTITLKKKIDPPHPRGV